MLREMMKSKIHRATVTQADLHYVGSITIDSDLLEEADIIANEKVSVVNINNGERFETYVIPGPSGSGAMCINGAAARLVQAGDLIIVISYAWVKDEELTSYEPKVLFVNEKNEIVSKKQQEEAFTSYR